MSEGSSLPVRCLAGHHAAVLCCKALGDGVTLLSSGEDGALCVHDLRLEQAAQGMRLGEAGEAVPSLALHPSERHTVFAACGTAVTELDLRQVSQLFLDTPHCFKLPGTLQPMCFSAGTTTRCMSCPQRLLRATGCLWPQGVVPVVLFCSRPERTDMQGAPRLAAPAACCAAVRGEQRGGEQHCRARTGHLPCCRR